MAASANGQVGRYVQYEAIYKARTFDLGCCEPENPERIDSEKKVIYDQSPNAAGDSGMLHLERLCYLGH